MMNLNHVLSVFGMVCLINPAFSQSRKRLPETQQNSLHAPAALKIDGKTSEWNNTFQAFNKATQLLYTISNDQENLYLAVQATDRRIINKITRAGLSLTINSTAKRTDKGGIRITFPTQQISVDLSASESKRASSLVGAGAARILQFGDSIAYDQNRRYIDKLRDIKVTGIKEISDSILSLYNDEGIKARALFDGTGAYNYELAIPLKYIRGRAGTTGDFIYHIRLNGTPQPTAGPAINSDEAILTGPSRPAVSASNPIALAMFSATDFWGTYRLAK